VQLPLDKFALERPMGLETVMVFPREADVGEADSGGEGHVRGPA
jgi:hypothetical protein